MRSTVGLGALVRPTATRHSYQDQTGQDQDSGEPTQSGDIDTRHGQCLYLHGRGVGVVGERGFVGGVRRRDRCGIRDCRTLIGGYNGHECDRIREPGDEVVPVDAA